MFATTCRSRKSTWTPACTDAETHAGAVDAVHRQAECALRDHPGLGLWLHLRRQTLGRIHPAHPQGRTRQWSEARAASRWRTRVRTSEGVPTEIRIQPG